MPLDDYELIELKPSWGFLISPAVTVMMMTLVCWGGMAVVIPLIGSPLGTSYWQAVLLVGVECGKMGIGVAAFLTALRVASYKRLTLEPDSTIVYAPVLGKKHTLLVSQISGIKRTSKTIKGRRGARHTYRRIQLLDKRTEVVFEFDPDQFPEDQVARFVSEIK